MSHDVNTMIKVSYPAIQRMKEMRRMGSAVERDNPRINMENIPMTVVTRTLLWSWIADFRHSQNCRGKGEKHECVTGLSLDLSPTH